MASTPNPIQIQKALSGMDYPASATDLVKNAEKAGADDSVLEALRGLPDKQYESPVQVNEAISDSN